MRYWIAGTYNQMSITAACPAVHVQPWHSKVPLNAPHVVLTVCYVGAVRTHKHGCLPCRGYRVSQVLEGMGRALHPRLLMRAVTPATS